MTINISLKISKLLACFFLFNLIGADSFAKDFNIPNNKEKDYLNKFTLKENLYPLIIKAIVKRDNLIKEDELLEEVIDAIDNSSDSQKFKTINDDDDRKKQLIDSEINVKFEKKEDIGLFYSLHTT